MRKIPKTDLSDFSLHPVWGGTVIRPQACRIPRQGSLFGKLEIFYVVRAGQFTVDVRLHRLFFAVSDDGNEHPLISADIDLFSGVYAVKLASGKLLFVLRILPVSKGIVAVYLYGPADLPYSF